MLRDNRAEYVRLKSRDHASRILVPLRLAEMTYTSRSVR